LFLKALERVFSVLTASSWLVRILAWGAVAILAAALVLLLWQLVRLLRPALVRLYRARRLGAAPVVTGEAELLAGPNAKQAAVSAAEHLARGGQWREAVRQLFVALLLSLDLLGGVDYRRESTNWEYVRQLRRNAPPLVSTLVGAVRVFEGRWYGREAATENDYEAMRAFLRQSALPGGTET